MTNRIQELISMKRKVLPKLIANDIINVQPMTSPSAPIFTLRIRYPDSMPKFKLIEEHEHHVPDGYCVIDVLRADVIVWIEEQPIHQWKPVDDVRYTLYDRYIIAEELFTLLVLKWS